MSLPQSPTVAIAPDVEIPLVGLGTWRTTGDETYAAVLHAIEAGYRHIDTATGYHNEQAVGRALRDCGVSRDEIFVTTKLPPGNAGRERETIDASLAALGLDHVDLWLIHWPPDGQARPDVWERLIEARTDGLTRAIGVSNYSAAQIDELTAATSVAPALNQIEWGPSLYDAAVAQAHRDREVVLEGWSPFLSTDLDAPALVEIADRRAVTTRQVVLRWHVDHGFVVIPKSREPQRIDDNFAIFGFTLDAGEIARIDALGRS
jgi:2,5-diketo-D-gluconate reductase A